MAVAAKARAADCENFMLGNNKQLQTETRCLVSKVSSRQAMEGSLSLYRELVPLALQSIPDGNPESLRRASEPCNQEDRAAESERPRPGTSEEGWSGTEQSRLGYRVRGSV
jgi:hypothetical protein